MELSGEYFYGNKISDYGIKHGYLDYGTLAKALNCVLANDLMALTEGVVGNWELISGDPEAEVLQWYVVDKFDLLQDIGEIVYYNEDLNVYLWGVTHWGTSWNYVLTDVPCNTKKY